jgi:SAM-dependent methyltransferase
MSVQIIGLPDFLKTPAGRYLLEWEGLQYDRAVADIFGFNALQLGLPEVDALQGNRMPHRWLALAQDLQPVTQSPGLPRAALVTDFSALPFPEASLDLVVLPHALELSRDPHATLREVERVLVPEGRVVICGFNPTGLWALRQYRARLTRRLGFGESFLPDVRDWIGYWRVRDWLRLLSFEVEVGHFGCYRPAMSNPALLQSWAWTDKVGARWWPILGSVYFVVAVKRVAGVRLLEPAWKLGSPVASAPVSVANRKTQGGATASGALKTRKLIERD